MDAETEIRRLRQEVYGLVAAISPWIGQDEMQARYGCTGQTLLAMERRGDIPTRIKGRWRRAEVMDWERQAA